MSKEVEDKIKASLVGGKLPCAVAFKISRDMKVSVGEIGATCNTLKIKVASCQLGCFP